ncbi:glyoxalase superfamily protein [Paenibacillus glycanilyticus]|uniref:glyoxalase superfamily protein n=1 Tax=Paenibacillus glycanilyticus TaxID=126569 RepID=UPI000FD7DA1A|nr:glyoxalase superfamily protein [Paenibacillus glycanilyticus]
MNLEQLVPILRIFDEAKAREFYVDFLGFNVDWEHRFEPDMPLYMQISKGGIRLHLSEHHGDCSPGSAIRIEMTGIRELHKDLLDKKYKYARPGLEETPWNTLECRIGDPFGNRIVFSEPMSGKLEG